MTTLDDMIRSSADGSEEQTYDLSRTVADIEAEAAKKGCVVVYPRLHELFIDIDGVDAFERFAQLYRMLSQESDLLAGFSVADSPSGRVGYHHVTVRMVRPLQSTLERIALQAPLGSDLKRELLSYRRMLAGAEPDAVSVFFRKAEAAE